MIRLSKILILTFITVFSISLHAAKYDNKVDPTELYEKATKHLKAEDYRKALRVLGKYTKSKPKDPCLLYTSPSPRDNR